MNKLQSLVAGVKKYAWVAGGVVGSTVVSLAAHAQDLFTAPSSSAVFTGVGAYSGTTFTEMLPVAYIVIGFLVGALIVSLLIGTVIRSVEKLTGKGKGGGRRGRRH